jgi:hypothetical protein
MSSDVELPASAPGRLGQATAVEQSRAVAEVQAAIYVARQFPRDIRQARQELDMSFGLMTMAERSFYKLPRGKDDVVGPTVQLAREVARCFTNFQYGISELRRDDDHAQSEMLAWAWDVENNTRAAHVFIVPHKRDRKNQSPVPLIDMQAIYENNANHAARRLREQMLAVIPVWFVEEAKARAYKTLAGTEGSLPERIDKAIAAFGAGYKLTLEQLERRLGRPTRGGTPFDVAQLTIIFQSLRRGELRVDVEFGDEPVTAEELTGGPAAKPAAKPAAGAVKPAASSKAASKDDELPDPPESWAPQDGSAT